jgi:hypothetical protein
MKEEFCKGFVRTLETISDSPGSGRVKLEIFNLSNSVWISEGANPVYVSYHWAGEYGSIIDFEGVRIQLPSKGVVPGTSEIVELPFVPPRSEFKGRFDLFLTLVREGKYWFEEASSFKPANISLNLGEQPQIAVEDLVVKPYQRERGVAFMHIPKCAGTAMREFLSNNLMPRPFDFEAVGGVSYVTFITKEFMGKLNYMGHTPYTLLRQYSPDGQMITVLREPLNRLLSSWLFWKSFLTLETSKRDDLLEPLIRKSRASLHEILTDESIAVATDNIALRMLVYPHPRLAENRFIEKKYDQELLAVALARLSQFAYFDVIENPLFESNLQNWFQSAHPYIRVNVTSPSEQRRHLYTEFTKETLDALDNRCRLDRIIWRAIAAARMPETDIDRCFSDALIRGISRHSAISSPSGSGEWSGWITLSPLFYWIQGIGYIRDRIKDQNMTQK